MAALPLVGVVVVFASALLGLGVPTRTPLVGRAVRPVWVGGGGLPARSLAAGWSCVDRTRRRRWGHGRAVAPLPANASGRRPACVASGQEGGACVWPTLRVVRRRWPDARRSCAHGGVMRRALCCRGVVVGAATPPFRHSTTGGLHTHSARIVSSGAAALGCPGKTMCCVRSTGSGRTDARSWWKGRHRPPDPEHDPSHDGTAVVPRFTPEVGSRAMPDAVSARQGLHPTPDGRAVRCGSPPGRVRSAPAEAMGHCVMRTGRTATTGGGT